MHLRIKNEFMRTTVDLPDPLFRQVKARAALDGVKLKDLITRYIESGLRAEGSAPSQERSQRSPLPVIAKANTGVPMPVLARAELAQLEVDEENAKYDRSVGR